MSVLPSLFHVGQRFGLKLVKFGVMMALLLVSGLACRVEFGVGQEAAPSGNSALVKPVVVASQPLSSAAAAVPSPTAPQILATPTSPVPTATPAPTLSPTATPTPPARLIPTTTTIENDELAVSVSVAHLVVSPTPTPIALLPARYPPHQLLIPAIKLDIPVATAGWIVSAQTGQSLWNVPENAAGWHKNSARPGHGSNVVLSGHHNLGAEVFRDLVNLKVGDTLILRADTYEYQYRVTDWFIVPELHAPEEQRRQNAQWIMPTVDERLTLVTCWPYEGNSHRLIVVARPTGFNKL